MASFQLLNSTDIVTTLETNEIVNFLFKNLDDESQNTKDHLLKSIDYALSKFPHQGGFLVLAKEGFKILGAVVVNKTNMEGYIPENVLVYIAVTDEGNELGLGKQLIQKAIEYTKGGIALHLRPNSPWQPAFEEMGFKFAYQEYRLIK